MVCIKFKRCIMMIHDGAGVSCFAGLLFFFFAQKMSANTMCMCALFFFFSFLFAGKTFVVICGSVELCGSVS